MCLPAAGIKWLAIVAAAVLHAVGLMTCCCIGVFPAGMLIIVDSNLPHIGACFALHMPTACPVLCGSMIYHARTESPLFPD
jgi:hypothetical protein